MNLKIQNQLIDIISVMSVDINVSNVFSDIIRFDQDEIEIHSIKFDNSY